MSTNNSQLDIWHAQEALQRERLQNGVGPGVNRLDQISGKTGMQIMQSILAGELHYPPIANTLDFLLMEVSEGRAVFQGAPGQAHLNPMGTIHGGWFATLLDSAMACAVQTMIPQGRAYTTTELSLNIVRALTPRVVRTG